MLRKLADIATWLDEHRLYASAQTIDTIIIKIAQTEFLEPDLTEEEPETNIWHPKSYHELNEIHSASPDFLELLQQHNPIFYQKWLSQLDKKGYHSKGLSNDEHTNTSYFGGNQIHLPRGMGKMPISELAHFIYPEDVLKNNADETLKRYLNLTRNQNNRAMFEGNYISSAQPTHSTVSKYKDYMFDPHAFNLVKNDYVPGRGTDPSKMKMPLFDPRILRQIVDPTDITEDAMRLRDKIKDKPLGTQLGYAMRNLNPEQMFGMWRKLKQTDETGKKLPFFYPRLQK